MGPDEAGDEERPRADSPLPPEDRLWRHPSEIAGGMPLPGAWPTPPPPPPSRSSHAIGALAAAGLAGALVAVGVMWFTRPTRVVVEDAKPAAAARTTPAAVFTPAGIPAESLARGLAPTLVEVEASRDGAWTSGTGIRLDADGNIAVATPVVAGAGTLMVTGHDGKRLRATVGGTDTATGITVLTVQSTSGTGVKARAVAATAGEPVAVIGAGSVSTASVQAVDLRTTVDPIVLHDAVQLDRSVPDDATGGVVVDADGALVGIVLTGSGPQDLAVLVPAGDAIAAARGLRDDGEVRRAWLGVRAIDLGPEAAELMGVEGGAQLTMVQAGSPAAAAGLRKGDVVTAIDDHPIGDASDLVVQLRRWHPGEGITVHWHRGKESGQTDVTLGG